MRKAYWPVIPLAALVDLIRQVQRGTYVAQLHSQNVGQGFMRSQTDDGHCARMRQVH